MLTLTKTMRDKLTPNQALEMLKAGNNRFVTNLKLNRNLLQQVNETSDEQYPFAFILSCIDSRTSAELIFDQGLGDIFSCRIAGNILNDDIIGSMEFACKIAGAKIVVVLGHTECGAIKGACNHLKMGHLTGLLDKISVVINETDEAKIADKSQYYDSVSKANVKNVLKQIQEKSPIINELIANEKIILVGAMYDISSGVVEFY
ncbi:MAG: carbonic anhydrase family protein [Alphaproteobacteria bacterium]